MTDEEGSISGELDVQLDGDGHGLVRYRNNATWLTIGNLDGRPPRTWDSIDELANAIDANKGAVDAAGNTIPFEA
ncbi:hypothetical protein [Hoyosella altamirensis]|nr:hypothetical protein [Hoyosella altamirensis]